MPSLLFFSIYKMVHQTRTFVSMQSQRYCAHVFLLYICLLIAVFHVLCGSLLSSCVVTMLPDFAMIAWGFLTAN